MKNDRLNTRFLASLQVLQRLGGKISATLLIVMAVLGVASIMACSSIGI